MGFLGDLNPFEEPGPLDPAGVLSGEGAAGGQYGDFIQMLADPLDLFGHRAEDTRDEIKDIQLGAAEESLDFQREILDEYEKLLGPFREQAKGNLPQYQAMATGGQTNALAPSPQYKLQTERGTRQINQKMAARGLSDSSARDRVLADLYLKTGQDEAARQYQRQLDMQRLGKNAMAQLGQGGRRAGSNVGSMYSQTGNALNQAYRQYGQQRQRSMSQGASALAGLSDYLMR